MFLLAELALYYLGFLVSEGKRKTAWSALPSCPFDTPHHPRLPEKQKICLYAGVPILIYINGVREESSIWTSLVYKAPEQSLPLTDGWTHLLVIVN